MPRKRTSSALRTLLNSKRKPGVSAKVVGAIRSSVKDEPPREYRRSNRPTISAVCIVERKANGACPFGSVGVGASSAPSLSAT